MGHNFGLLHAASLRCSGAIVGTGCTASEYGDPFDTMGNQRAMHFNAAQKDLLAGFTDRGQDAHGRYRDLHAVADLGGRRNDICSERSGSQQPAVLDRIPPTGRLRYADRRLPNAGAIVHVAAPFESICSGCGDDTELLDMTPGTSSFNDAALVVGQTYTDTAHGLSLNVISATASALTVSVTMPGSVTSSATRGC